MEQAGKQPSILTIELLQESICQIARGIPHRNESLGVDFALALATVLDQKGIGLRLRIGFRTETDFSEELAVPSTSYSHTVVQALGTTWDIEGSEAKDRLEVRWSTTDTRNRFTWKTIRREKSRGVELACILSSNGGPDLDQTQVDLLTRQLNQFLPGNYIVRKEPALPAFRKDDGNELV
jgi:hypothetical protein